MTEQTALDLPVTADEPQPWTVSVWRYHTESREPFLTREEAVEYAAALADSDDCYMEGVYGPSGTLDEDASKEAAPWRFRHRSVVQYGPTHASPS